MCVSLYEILPVLVSDSVCSGNDLVGSDVKTYSSYRVAALLGSVELYHYLQSNS